MLVASAFLIMPTQPLTVVSFSTQFELLDTLYMVLRQMPRFRRASYFYTSDDT